MIADAAAAGVTRLICVGCTPEDSERAVKFVASRPNTWASIGIHPHEAKRYVGDQAALDQFAALATQPKVVAVGECGLDYFYTHSSKEDQEQILHYQLRLAQAHNLPMIFHVREAFGDFWPIFDQYPGIRGVVHSFTATERELEQILARGLHVGLNGITTFMKDPAQIAAVKAVPLDRLLLETDAPFLTPIPYRGTICEPKHVRVTAAFLADLRGEHLETLTERSTQNARQLFEL
jgi:TatD DNase family protein